MSGHPEVRLLLADVDGTLVTQDKVLTEAAKGLDSWVYTEDE
jgi:hydroxymethylpyrimidine pyrophosphatase-like HAD family hydrolase